MSSSCASRLLAARRARTSGLRATATLPTSAQQLGLLPNCWAAA
ncbi:hypothetical protein [Hymenobacter sp. YC55]|nr:hypothetical protein [Hymenobacter sp. YC55]MDF7815444.1 hypothetical protein [Hymenobacter sp. YC55]